MNLKLKLKVGGFDCCAGVKCVLRFWWISNDSYQDNGKELVSEDKDVSCIKMPAVPSH